MLHWRQKNLGLGFAKLLAMLSKISYKYDYLLSVCPKQYPILMMMIIQKVTRTQRKSGSTRSIKNTTQLVIISCYSRLSKQNVIWFL